MNPDRLVLLALGESAPDPAEDGHVAGCAACRDDLDATRRVAGIGRQSHDLAGLPSPPARVWRRVAAATGVPEDPATPPTRPAPRRSRPRTAGLVAVTAAAAVAATLAVPRLLDRPPAETAAADLAAVPAARTEASGVARVVGGKRLHLRVSGLPSGTGYYEVWLIDPETARMVSVGVLGDGGGELPLPSTIDLTRYRLVDVSAEEYDGDATHSGRSLLRGTLAG